MPNVTVKDLANLAGIKNRNTDPKEIWGYEKNLETFAEMIIQECMLAVGDNHAAIRAITNRFPQV